MKRYVKSSDSSSAIVELNSLPVERGVSKVKYELVKEYQTVLQQFPVGAVLEHRTEAGLEKFTKIEDGDFGRWEHFRAPHKITQNCAEFDIATWLAGRGNITRSDITQTA